MTPNSNHNNAEHVPKKASPSEAVDNLISKKKSEKAGEGMQEVYESAEGVQSEVADVMSGVEGISDKVSEKKSESGERRDISGGSAQQRDDRAATISQGIRSKKLPREEVMVTKVRTAINDQIKKELQEAKKLDNHLDSGSAQEYSKKIARIRKLQETLNSLAQEAYQYVKNLYLKYFSSDGRRKKPDEL
jgi:hypothetical protein